VGFKKRSIRLENVWGGEGYLGADIISSNFNLPLRVINVYGPFHNRKIFWERLLDSNFIQSKNLILGGDLNFSLGLAESWGNKAQTDPVTAFFEVLMDSYDLLNIDMEKLMPTWRNRRIGEDTLARRLDCFLIKAPLLTRLDRIHQWVGSGRHSDHFLVFL